MEPNKDKVKGTINDFAGSLKERVGRATQNQDLENEGTIQKTKGKIQKVSGAIQDAVKQGQALLGIKSKKS